MAGETVVKMQQPFSCKPIDDGIADCYDSFTLNERRER